MFLGNGHGARQHACSSASRTTAAAADRLLPAGTAIDRRPSESAALAARGLHAEAIDAAAELALRARERCQPDLCARCRRKLHTSKVGYEAAVSLQLTAGAQHDRSTRGQAPLPESGPDHATHGAAEERTAGAVGLTVTARAPRAVALLAGLADAVAADRHQVTFGRVGPGRGDGGTIHTVHLELGHAIDAGNDVAERRDQTAARRPTGDDHIVTDCGKADLGGCEVVTTAAGLVVTATLRTDLGRGPTRRRRQPFPEDPEKRVEPKGVEPSTS